MEPSFNDTDDLAIMQVKALLAIGSPTPVPQFEIPHNRFQFTSKVCKFILEHNAPDKIPLLENTPALRVAVEAAATDILSVEPSLPAETTNDNTTPREATPGPSDQTKRRGPKNKGKEPATALRSESTTTADARSAPDIASAFTPEAQSALGKKRKRKRTKSTNHLLVTTGAQSQLPVPASAPPTSNFPLGSILAPQALAPQIATPYFGPHPADLSTVPMAIPVHGFWPATPGYLYTPQFPVPNQHWANITGPLPSTYCQGHSPNLFGNYGISSAVCNPSPYFLGPGLPPVGSYPGGAIDYNQLLPQLRAGAPLGITDTMFREAIDFTNAQPGDSFPVRIASLLHDLDAKTSQAPVVINALGGAGGLIGRTGVAMSQILRMMKDNIAMATDTANDVTFFSFDSREAAATLTAAARLNFTHKDFAISTLIRALTSKPKDIALRLGCANNLSLMQSSDDTRAMDTSPQSASENHLLLESAVTTLHVALARLPCFGLNMAFAHLRQKLVAWRRQRTPPELARRAVRTFLHDLIADTDRMRCTYGKIWWCFPKDGIRSTALSAIYDAADRFNQSQIDIHAMVSEACGISPATGPRQIKRGREKGKLPDGNPPTTDSRTTPIPKIQRDTWRELFPGFCFFHSHREGGCTRGDECPDKHDFPPAYGGKHWNQLPQDIQHHVIKQAPPTPRRSQPRKRGRSISTKNV